MTQFEMKLPCPCCGRPFPPRLRVSGPIRQAIVYLIASRPDGIGSDEIFDHVYRSSNDPPVSGRNLISVIISMANKELRPQGYEIKAHPRYGRGSRYQVIEYAGPEQQPARHTHPGEVARPQPTSP